ncbi:MULTISPECIES: hypothetical protein [unclassified Alistipes]|jgi:hypothetical protein|uniref:hypothetical protein n=1 Tax=unclassified Alistipes TaxID=2608932 RepID=UPI000B39F5B8|nr:hypothetical protein [Alistipes sp. An31A]OUO22244.1 hypothetical protein B5F90_05000 [Alistipes sp. An31A]
MKKILFSLLGRALLLVSLTALASCNDDKTEPSGGTPSVAIGEITPQSDRLTFALTLRDAEKAFYLCLPATESAPSAETLAAQGIPVSQSQTVTVDGLLPETAYTISAVAMQGDRLGSVATASATTAPSDAEPAVKLTPGEATTTSLSFSLEMQDCARAAYLLIANPKQGQTPDAEEILRSGTTVESDGTHTVNELTPATTYLIAAVGEKDSKRSEVVTIEMTTGFDASAPATFDRQVAGFYYGVPAGYNYAEYYVVLSEGEATEQEGIYTTTGAGRTLSIDLYYFEPLSGDPAITQGTYKYATSKSLRTFDPEKTRGTVNDGKGGIRQIEFKEGTIDVRLSGSTYTITASLVTTDGEEFTGSYTGPLTLENREEEQEQNLPPLEKELTGMSFVRAIAKYYNNDETTDQCTVELYDVEPGGSDGYYYLLDAGHKLSVDFLVATGDDAQIVEGTYTVADTNAALTLIPGYEESFLDSTMPLGTYCEEYSEERVSTYGFASSGTVTVTRTGDTYSFDVKLKTSKGYRIEGTYEGAIEMYDKR